MAPENVNLSYLSVSFQQDLRVLICRWHSDVNMLQFTEGYIASLKVAQNLQANFWLQDLRKRNNSDNIKLNWFEHIFAPDLAKALPAVTHIAYLVSPVQRSFLTAGSGFSSEEIKMGQQLIVKHFIKEQDAMLWLGSYQAHAIV